MHVKLHPRFFLIFGVFLVLSIMFGSNLLIKKRFEINIVDSKRDEVLAAETQGSERDKSFDLIGGEVGGELGGELGSADTSLPSISNTTHIEKYIPVTISYTVKEGDTLQKIAEKYNADAQTIADFPNNKLGDDLQLTVGQILIIPNGYIENAPPPPPIAVGTGQFMWPAQGRVTQFAYSWHAGSIDIGLSMGTPIKAADNGKIIAVERFTTGYGVHVIIDHGDGLTSLYAHLTDTDMKVGNGINKGDVIGISGSTGRSTGPHLHFEVRNAGSPIDPMTLLPSM